MDDSVFAIDTLNLRLPAGFNLRADAIARQVGKELARWPIRGDFHAPTLQIPRITVYGEETDQVVARRIAQSIHRQVDHIQLNQGKTHGVD